MPFWSLVALLIKKSYKRTAGHFTVPVGFFSSLKGNLFYRKKYVKHKIVKIKISVDSCDRVSEQKPKEKKSACLLRKNGIRGAYLDFSLDWKAGVSVVVKAWLEEHMIILNTE